MKVFVNLRTIIINDDCTQCAIVYALKHTIAFIKERARVVNVSVLVVI